MSEPRHDIVAVVLVRRLARLFDSLNAPRAAGSETGFWTRVLGRLGQRGLAIVALVFAGAGVEYAIVMHSRPVAMLAALLLVGLSAGLIWLLSRRRETKSGKERDGAEVTGRYRTMQRGLEDGEFSLVYQPEVSLRTGRIEAVEALIRWRRGDGMLTMPNDFIPFAEETGLVRQLGTWVLREACRQLADWRVTLPAAAALRVSVNVSAVQLSDPKFVSVVENALRDAGLAPDRLVLEITETSVVSDPKVFRVILPELRSLGVLLAMDDFGTGYSSIGYLQSFRFDYVKLDQRFVAPLARSDGDVDLVGGLVRLTKGVGSDIIAEGVTTARQAQICRNLGCDWAQGHFYSPPCQPEEIEALLEAPYEAVAA